MEMGILVGVGTLLGAVAVAGVFVAGLYRERLRQIYSRYAQSEERIRNLDQLIEQGRQQIESLTRDRAELEERLRHERQSYDEKIALLQETKTMLGDTLAGLSQEALSRNNELFLSLAQERFAHISAGAQADLSAREQAIAHLVGPLVERLGRVDSLMSEMETKREGAYQRLTEQVRALVEGHLPQLHRETANLVKALRQPAVRGRWGELQLRRVVEMAGMLNYCDFTEQGSVVTDEGRLLRPDLVVRLPGGRHVVVDAKAPVDAYLNAMETDDEGLRGVALKRHAAQVRTHLTQLGKKSYWEQFPSAPEFVVMFVPGEVFFSAALQEDPGLIECGVDQKVIPASPTTLIALLRAVAYGWQQEAVARNAEEIAALGRELYKRVAVLGRGWSDMGAKLRATVECYNKAVGTLEGRVLPQARKLKDLRATDEADIPVVEPVAEEPRILTAQELLQDEDL